jgi:hypothetical protein
MECQKRFQKYQPKENKYRKTSETMERFSA